MSNENIFPPHPWDEFYDPADLDKMLGNDGRETVRNEFLEVIF